ncbi:hypothetical protein C3489_18920 [Streptomyces sp. Ru71]|nr:hypothetical protein C3489_18920 [Streptomyces sp. Ru71]
MGGISLTAAACAYAALGPAPALGPQPAESVPTLHLTPVAGGTAAPPAEAGTVSAARFTARDGEGKQVGGGYETCAQDLTGPRAVTVYCTGVIDIDGKGKIAYQASRPLPGARASGSARITGVVTGGTGVYRGTTGEMTLMPPDRGDGAWTAQFR